MPKFKVLRGTHCDASGTYKKGDIVESSQNLLEQNSPGSIRFVLLEGAPSVSSDVPIASVTIPKEPESIFGFSKEEIEQLNVESLRELAADNEVDLSGCNRKADIISAIVQSAESI